MSKHRVTTIWDATQDSGAKNPKMWTMYGTDRPSFMI